MEKRQTNHPLSSIQTSMFAENYEVNIRDKNEMRQRLLGTQLAKPENIKIKVWEPGDQYETITFQRATSSFGDILVASTTKGLCYLGFEIAGRESIFVDLRRRFPENPFVERTSAFQETAIKILNNPQLQLSIPLHLKGTKFQEALMDIFGDRH